MFDSIRGGDPAITVAQELIAMLGEEKAKRDALQAYSTTSISNGMHICPLGAATCELCRREGRGATLRAILADCKSPYVGLASINTACLP